MKEKIFKEIVSSLAASAEEIEEDKIKFNYAISRLLWEDMSLLTINFYADEKSNYYLSAIKNDEDDNKKEILVVNAPSATYEERAKVAKNQVTIGKLKTLVDMLDIDLSNGELRELKDKLFEELLGKKKRVK